MEATGHRRPGRPRSERARRAALAAALALLADRGLAATSVDAVCERAGVSKATIYRHWGSKERLCIDAVACADAGEQERRPAAAAERTEPATPRAQIVALLRSYAAMLDPTASGRLLARLVGDTVDSPELARVWRARILAPRRARLISFVSRAVEQGELRADTDVDLVVDLLLGALTHGGLVAGTAMPAPERVVEAVWDGFRPRSC